MQYDLFFSSFHSVSPASRLLILIADESVIIYNKHFRIPASPRNFSRILNYRTFRRNSTHAYATIPYLCVPPCPPEEKRSFSARRLSPFLPLSLLVRPAFPTFRPSLSTRSHTTNNEAHVRSPPRTRAHPFSCPFLRPSLSLCLSYTLRLLSYPLVHTQTCAERVHMLGHNGAVRGLSTLLDPFRHQRVQRFLLDFTRLHRNRIFTVTEATILTVERRERRQCNDRQQLQTIKLKKDCTSI